MSFRLRVLAVVMLVAVTAVGATVWLTLRQASAQITESATTDRRIVDQVSDALRNYGESHGTWEGVAELVRTLGDSTGQRIRVATEWDEVVSDTDQLAGRTPRQVGTVTTVVDPRPTLTLPEDPKSAIDVTLKSIATYRAQVRLAACHTRRGSLIKMSKDSYGVPRYEPATVIPACQQFAKEPERDASEDNRLALACAPALTDGRPLRPRPVVSPSESQGEPVNICLSRVFTDRVSDMAPVPVRVTFGAGSEPSRQLEAGPLVGAAAGVAVLAIAGTLLLSRRVLRPIGRLTDAAARLGRGDLASRVAVVGHDEVAELGRSFNRMADSLQRAEERQRRLVADVAHELRTPLANLRGYLEALKDGVIAPDPELFASLHEEAVLQQRIVNDLQDLALAEAGDLAYHRVVVDLAELLEIGRVAHLAVAEPAGVRLLVAVPQPVLVNVDPDRMRQVFGNLITNALRATPNGGSVTLSAGYADGQAIVRVADTGTGIPPEVLPYVFDRFWRGDQARGRRTGGSGLGLAIVRQIVTDHRGTISVTSEVGTGTTFTITLPPAN